MRIIDKKTDYFDYISKIYDPSQSDSLVFDRRNWIDDDEVYKIPSEKEQDIRLLSYATMKVDKFELNLIVFAGIVYPTVGIYSTNRIGTRRLEQTVTDAKSLEKTRKEIGSRKIFSTPFRKRYFEPFPISSSPKMCYTQAVYGFNRDGLFLKEGFAYLKDYGFAKFIEPQQAYGELSMYVADIMNVEKEYVASNEEKMNSHGFYKRSFRSNHPGRA